MSRTGTTAQQLYQLLENEVVPLFYERDSDGVPRKWLAWSKEAIATVAPVFSTRRMVKEYVTEAVYAGGGGREGVRGEGVNREIIAHPVHPLTSFQGYCCPSFRFSSASSESTS